MLYVILIEFWDHRGLLLTLVPYLLQSGNAYCSYPIKRTANYWRNGLGRDILRRNLKPGDRYITAVEAAEQLGVSRMSADRAMNVLVRRQTLVRQRGRGTFVGPSVKASSPISAVHVHLLMFMEGETSTTLPSQPAVLAGLRRVMPSAILHAHFLPFTQGCHHAKQLVQNEPLGTKSVWVLAVSPYEVQQWFAQESVPAIVLGEAYPGIALPDMEADQMESGVQLLRLASRLGAKRFTYVNSQNWRRGDTAALNGALQELGSFGKAADCLEVCNISSDVDETKRLLRELLVRCTDPENKQKQGLICRSHHFVELVLDIAEEIGVSVPEDLIVVYNRYWTDEHPILVPCVDELATIEEGFAIIASLAGQVLERSSQEVAPVRLPVRFVFPEGYDPL